MCCASEREILCPHVAKRKNVNTKNSNDRKLEYMNVNGLCWNNVRTKFLVNLSSG